MILARLIDLYSLVVIAAVIVSWVQLPPYHPIVRFTRMLTEPALAPIRKILPPMGGLDFSPLILIFGLQIIKRMLF